MNLRRLFCLTLLLAAPALADEGVFPGLRSVLTDAEWKRAGLDRLSPDQIGVIDAALISHYMRAVTGVGPLPSTAALAARSRADQAAMAGSAPRGIWDRFGLTKLTDTDWRTQPPLTARCTAWQGSNRFVLDNGQVWEGVEIIPFDVAGKPVIIEARPMGNFALKLEEKGVAVMVRRVK